MNHWITSNRNKASSLLVKTATWTLQYRHAKQLNTPMNTPIVSERGTEGIQWMLIT